MVITGNSDKKTVWLSKPLPICYHYCVLHSKEKEFTLQPVVSNPTITGAEQEESPHIPTGKGTRLKYLHCILKQGKGKKGQRLQGELNIREGTKGRDIGNVKPLNQTYLADGSWTILRISFRSLHFLNKLLIKKEGYLGWSRSPFFWLCFGNHCCNIQLNTNVIVNHNYKIQKTRVFSHHILYRNNTQVPNIWWLTKA